jgi:hypothetical protein
MRLVLATIRQIVALAQLARTLGLEAEALSLEERVRQAISNARGEEDPGTEDEPTTYH